MSDLSPSVLFNILVILIFPFICGYIMVKLKSSLLTGYILSGIILGFFLGNKLPKEFISHFSMVGLVLLVFTIGLETNFTLIKRFGKFVLVGGISQIVLSGVFIFFLSLFFKLNSIESLFFGLAFAMSSTAVVAKIIQDRGEENSLLGGLAIGVLVLQDLSLIPILIITSSFSSTADSLQIAKTIFFNLLKAGAVLVFLYYFGQKLIPFIINKLARVSRELLNLFIIILIVIALYGFTILGLSYLLAAFIAGVLLGQTLEHYHIFSQIRPFRDLFAVIFFVFLGLTFDFSYILSHLSVVLPFTFLIMSLKFLVLTTVFLIFKFHSKTAFSLGLYLFQIGEGAFVIVYQGFNGGNISSENYLLAVSTVLITLLLTPVIINKKEKIYLKIKSLINKFFPSMGRFIAYRLDREVPNVDVLPLKNHIIICGYGRVGHYIGRALMLANIPFIAIDYNFHIVEKARKEGINIIYGDPTEIDVLDYIEVESASVLILALPERYSQETIILQSRTLNRDLMIFARVHREDDQFRMKDLGVNAIIQPEFEASLSIIRKVLLIKRVNKDEIMGKIKRLKIEHGMI